MQALSSVYGVRFRVRGLGCQQNEYNSTAAHKDRCVRVQVQ